MTFGTNLEILFNWDGVTLLPSNKLVTKWLLTVSIKVYRKEKISYLFVKNLTKYITKFKTKGKRYVDIKKSR